MHCFSNALAQSDVADRSAVSHSVCSSVVFVYFAVSSSSRSPFLIILDSSLSYSLVFLFLIVFSREMNVRKHSKPGAVPVVSEREKNVVAVVK